MKAFLLAITSVLTTYVSGQFVQPDYSAEHIAKLRATTCTNLQEVADSVGFSNEKSDPYTRYGENVNIDLSENCYVHFDDASRTTYRLVTQTAAQAAAANTNGLVYITHERPCGTCSDLKNLATYLDTPDLTNPVRSCGFKVIQNNQIGCLEDIGFRDACTWIWYWNTKNTKKTKRKGGCLGTCLANVFTDNIQPRKRFFGSNPCDGCKNTINGQSACEEFQYKNGPFRLNPCLQCDECRSGPKFQKIAGRTRRASGIESAIARPDTTVAEITHFYDL